MCASSGQVVSNTSVNGYHVGSECWGGVGLEGLRRRVADENGTEESGEH